MHVISETSLSSLRSRYFSLSGVARVALVCAAIFWGTGIGLGYRYIQRYENSPTATEAVAGDWPVAARCPLSTSQPTLVMFVHPRCPCSRASLQELAELLHKFPNQLNVNLFFWQPAEADNAWLQSELWLTAAAIPGIRLWQDPDGTEQARFGARASGEVFLYTPGGTLKFHGGLTASRGHVGMSRGRLAIESLLAGNTSPASTTPVFGCELGSLKCGPLTSAVEKKRGMR